MGGQERMVIDLAKYQISKGNLVTLITISNDGNDFKKETDEFGIKVIVLKQDSGFKFIDFINLLQVTKTKDERRCILLRTCSRSPIRVN